jgi:F-type H+-transporting ATPase subunit c
MWHLAFGYLGMGLGAGLCLVAAAFGIARLSSAALEGSGRQPEAADKLRLTMIIPAAMIEGLGLFALVIILLGVLALNKGIPIDGSSAGTGAEASH